MEWNEALVRDCLVMLRSVAEIRQRWHPISFILDTLVDSQADGTRAIPESRPFVWFTLAYSSIRDYDGHTVRVQWIRTAENTYLHQPALLDAICGNAGAGPGVGPVGPALISGSVELDVRLQRLIATDAAETYPGPDVDSIIDLVFGGVEIIRFTRKEADAVVAAWFAANTPGQ